MNLNPENRQYLDKILAYTNTQGTVVEDFLKLTEESGEAAAEYLKLTGSIDASKSPIGTPEAFMEEVVDALIVMNSLVSRTMLFTNTSGEEVQALLTKKLAKWASKLPEVTEEEATVDIADEPDPIPAGPVCDTCGATGNIHLMAHPTTAEEKLFCQSCYEKAVESV